MSYIGIAPSTAAFPFDQFSGNGTTTAFTLTYAPANTTSIIVSISGVVQNPNTYSVSNLTLTFSAAPPTGTNNIAILYLGIPATSVTSPGNTAYLTTTVFTATGGQTTFTPSAAYQVGYINVIRNGSQLAPADFTATNGTTVVLANACVAGDTIVTQAYTLASIANALPLTGGTVTGATTFSSNVTVSGTLTASGGITGVTQIQPISASVAANALTISASALSLSFRSTTLGSGTITSVTGTPSSLVVPASATLGTVNAVQSRLVVIALNNAGTIELAVVNIAGGTQLDETNLISTTAITSGSTSASTVYSTTARTSVAYRVIGYIESTQTTAGTWATAPSTIQGVGGQALTAMSSVGYGQTWQSVTRTSGTTYYNTTGKPIIVAGYWSAQTVSCGANLTVNGVITSYANSANANGAIWPCFALVPPGGSYVQTLSNMSTALCELR